MAFYVKGRGHAIDRCRRDQRAGSASSNRAQKAGSAGNRSQRITTHNGRLPRPRRKYFRKEVKCEWAGAPVMALEAAPEGFIQVAMRVFRSAVEAGRFTDAYDRNLRR